VTREDLMKVIDDATSPQVMSKKEAFDYLGDVIDDLESRREALSEEMANEADEADEADEGKEPTAA